MAVVIKSIRGREYRYFQQSQRVNGKVVTKSIYLGAVNPKRKRRGGFAIGPLIPNLIVGALKVAGLIAKGRLGPPGGRAFKSKDRYDPLHREKQKAQKAIEALDKKYGIDKTNAETFNASRARLPKEMLREHFLAERAAHRAVDAERATATAPVSADMKAFNERVAATREGSSAATDPSEASTGDEGDS